MLVKSIIENKGHAEETLLDNFYNEGYNHASLIETVCAMGIKWSAITCMHWQMCL